MTRTILHLLGRFSPSWSPKCCSPLSCRRFLHSNVSVFAEGDTVLLSNTSKSRQWVLTKPLKRGSKTQIFKDTVKHEAIIGKSARDTVPSTKNNSTFRITLPTLEDYITLSPRKVTPIYNADASLIVSLLDIHVFPPDPSNEKLEPLEILEAGTGHGSLTLHLARAVHAANPAPPKLPPESPKEEEEGQTDRGEEGVHPSLQGNHGKEYNAWRSRRGAIVHSVEVSKDYSTHAQSIVRGFRRGMYAGSVDFNVAHVEDWIASQIRERQVEFGSDVEPFLSYAILDMPSAKEQLANVAPMLRSDGLVAVFMPSISQIAECEKFAYENKLGLALEKVIELGTGISGGRLWDVRFTKARKRHPEPSAAVEAALDVPSKEESAVVESSDEETTPVEHGSNEEDKMVLVCRPKVGVNIVGGGFVGIWRRMKY